MDVQMNGCGRMNLCSCEVVVVVVHRLGLGLDFDFFLLGFLWWKWNSVVVVV